MESSESEMSEIFDKVCTIHPVGLPLFYTFLCGWQKIQKNRLEILALQRKLNYLLLMHMKRRQTFLELFSFCVIISHGQLTTAKLKSLGLLLTSLKRLVEVFTGPKMMCLLEHIRSPYQFLKLFRIKLPTFFKIKEILYSNDSNCTGWMPEIELLLFLFWLSGGLSYKKVEKLLGISETILCDMFHSIFERFLNYVCQVIRFPRDKFDYLSRGYIKLTGSHIFGLALGCLDAFHVSIAFPSQKIDLQYLNDSDEFSVQVQVVCDYRGALMDIAVGFPGTLLKPHVLQCTPLYLGRLLPPSGFVLMSGHGYPCLQEPVCIIPPFIDADSLEKKTFNKHHDKVHSVLRKSVGQMFDRWRRIFSKPIMYPVSEITNIIIACAMIHNISLEMDDIWPKETAVNFSVNHEHLSLVEGQTSGTITQIHIAEHTVSYEMPMDDEGSNLSDNE